MHFTTLISSIALLSRTAWAGYSLQDDYGSGSEFFSKFQFFTGADPTEGFVEYVDQSAAQQAGLISYPAGGVQFGADSKQTTTTGRKSVRLTSNAVYNTGLVILDLAHMPSSACGSWPAFWMVGPNWPNSGEIDIIEGVNDQTYNAMTLHTGDSCSISNSAMSGSIFTNNCDVSGGSNTGCSIHASSSSSYGNGFNANNGGTYATEWTDSGISIYFWPHGSEPADVSNGSPNPSSWGTPVAQFGGSGCNYANSFQNQQIVFDITFCGQWAGQVWPGSSCESQNGGATCNSVVGSNPSAFDQSYWTVRSLKVYSENGAAPEASSSAGWGASASTNAGGVPTSTWASGHSASTPAGVAPTSFWSWGQPGSTPAGAAPTSTPASAAAPAFTHKHGPGHGPGHGTGRGTGHGHHHAHQTSSTFAISTRPAASAPLVSTAPASASNPAAAGTSFWANAPSPSSTQQPAPTSTQPRASSFWHPGHTWVSTAAAAPTSYPQQSNGWLERDMGGGHFAFESPVATVVQKAKRAEETTAAGGNGSSSFEEVDVEGLEDREMVRVRRHMRHHRSRHGGRRL